MDSIFGILQPLVDVLFTVLSYIHEELSLSWGWSIVVLTVIVRIFLIPLTVRQFKSMRAMQELQPQIKKLQEKYKSDKQTLNKKMMEFYQENEVSPFGSCLPLVLQMPVRHLQNKGETRPERTNLILLVELHHLLIQGLFIALVLLLELLDLRLQLLHGPHALELPDRQWNKEDPHDNGQDDNRPSPAERQFLVYV